MKFNKLIGFVCTYLFNLEEKVQFSNNEMAEIVHTAKKENLPFLNQLLKIKNLSFFDMCYLMRSNDLSKEKIEIIKEAFEMYYSSEELQKETTCDNFIYKIIVNISILNKENLDVFKEITLCKKDIYNFTKMCTDAIDFSKIINQEKKPCYAFEKVFHD